MVTALGTQIIMLKDKGLLAPHRSVHQTAYAKGFYDPEGYWTDTYDLYVTIAYNTKMMPKNAVPKSWEDLLDATLERRQDLPGSQTPRLVLRNDGSHGRRKGQELHGTTARPEAHFSPGQQSHSTVDDRR